MKIMVCGSASFAKKMIEISKQLKLKGHDVLLTSDIEYYANSPDKKSSYEEELSLAKQNDIMKEAFSKLAQSDAVLIVNNEKKGIKGYLGTSVLMELALAYHLNKKIFLMNPIDKKQNYAIEVELINPIIVNGDLANI